MIGSSSGCSVAVIALLAARPQFLSAHVSHADAPTVAALAEVGRRLREGEDIDATLADSLGFLSMSACFGGHRATRSGTCS